MDAFRQWAFDRRDPTHSQRVYDWWSRHDRVYAAFVTAFLLGRTGELRDRTIAALSLAPGDTVLDVGCGPGSNFERLADAVGPTGTVVGVDASPGMVERARARGEQFDCNIDVVRADTERLPVANERVDGVCATLSLSAMGDTETVVAGLSDVSRPGGRIAVLDVRSFQTAPLRWLNPLIEGVSAAVTNWYPDAPIMQTVDETFAAVSSETFHGGTVYVVTGSKLD
ncbi:class I SAM-dependent methyltransferase [Haloarcula onubensis]|uniref:Methyltransferase domain-containing protein n=1 Tax=Haloarcula onubensis TaxID=2950539 RepID=A0ABU2FPK3_9EURY|nr:methyltransferase domain-containing protein [Halomicroarcula sp. S3CR25-11]MDS0282688.1 methyltransferase domain-containing protein [Halomicroarcula sp. S3CR25-11]